MSDRDGQHVDDRNVEIRLNPLDECMRGIARNRDDVRIAVLELLAGRVQGDRRVHAGTHEILGSIGDLRILFNQQLDMVLTRAAGVLRTILSRKSTVAAGPTPPTTPILNVDAREPSGADTAYCA